MTNVELVKKITRIGVSVGSMSVTRAAIKALVATPTIPSKILVGGTAFVLGSMLGDAAGNYTDAQIDHFKAILDGKEDLDVLSSW